MTMQGGTARDRLRARAQAMYGGKRREDEEQQNRQNQRQEVETPAVGSARDRLRQRASAMGVVTGQGEGESITMPERKTTWTDKVRSGGRTGNYTTVVSTPEQQESVLRKGLSGKRPQRTDAEQVESLLRKGGTTEAVKASKKTGGKFDVGDYSKLLGESFAQGVAEGTAGTLAAGETLIGKGLDKLFPGAGFEGSGFFNALYNGRPDWKFFGKNGLVGIRQSRERTQQKLAEDVEDIETGSEMGTKVAKKAASFGGDVAYGMGNALPMAAEAVITGGTSLLPTTTKELETLGINVVQKSGLAGKLEEAAKLAGNTLRSREYWTSFFSEVGMDYYEALDNGATDDEATRYALSSAMVNSVIEIGGGIQKIPEAPTFRTWIKGAHEEGMEEIQQGIVSRLMENAVYDKKNPLVSVTDENAVVNPVTAANEYAGGFAVGGLLGGVQQGMAKRAQTRQEAELAQYQESLDKLGKEFTPAAKEMAQERLSLDSEDYTAQKVMNALDSGEAVSGEDIRTLIRDNVNAHNTAALAEIKEKIAQRLTDLGETKDANAVADAMVRYFTGETRGKDKASRKQRAADQDTIFRSRYGDHVGQELLQTKNVPQWVQGLPSLTTAYEYEQAHRPVAEQQTGAEAPATQEAETSVEQRAEATEQSAEPEKLTSAIVRKAAASRETLEQLGIDPQGKTGSQLRAEVRQALTERQAAKQEVQQRTQTAQQTQNTQETAQQTQGEPVTLEEASKAYGKQAKAFLRTYQQGQDVEKFSEAYRIAHEMGQSNVPYRVVQRMRSLDYLTEAQKDIAYRTGASVEKQEGGGKKATWRKQGVVRAENGAKLSDLSKTFNVPQKQGYKILSDIAKATGVDIVLYRSKGDAEGNITEAEGRFRRSENTIYIDVNSGIANVNSTADFSQYTMLRTFNHEFTHFIENADEEYRELRKLVFEVMQEKLDGQGGGVTVDDLIREKQDKYRQALGQDISYEKASREVVADAMTDILPDSHFMETLYNRNATLAEKLIGKLKDFIAKVKAYFDGLTTNTKAEAALLKEMRDGGLHYLEGIVEAYDKAATAAVENYQGAETRSEGGENQYMARGRYWRPQLKRAEWELLERRMSAEIKSGENFLDEATKWVYADEKGVQVFALYGIGDGTEATPLYAVGGKPASVKAEMLMDYIKEEQSYDGDRKALDALLKGYGHSEGNERSNLSNRRGGRTAAGRNAALHGGPSGSDGRRASGRGTENQRGVKDQFSIRDSEGRSLTEAQQDYFKDSKVRDAEGRLKVVYHGSGAVFTKFSADFMSQNGSSEGQGFYFTDYKPMAEGYSKKGGQLLEGYLDMKKPLSDSEVTLTSAEVRNLIKAIDPTGDDLVLNYDSKGGMGYPSRAWYNRSVEDTLRATMSTSDSDSEILAELANGMGNPGAVLKSAREVLGYDGYIVEGKYDNATVYVAFDSSQFKNVDNQSPTADPDIRYSIREIGGKVIPVLDTQKNTRHYSVAEAYLKTLVDTEHPFATILMDAQPVYIGKDLPGEYRGSEYTKSMEAKLRLVKMQAATNLDEMLLLAENGEWRENIKEKHKVDAKNGWYRYSTQFAVPVLDIKKSVDHYTVYSGTLLIRNDADGKSYLYDLLDIKKEKVISTSSFSARGHSEVLAPKPSQTQYTQNQTESQAQIRSSTLSDRDVLRIAAQMAKNSESRSLTDADRARLGIIEQKLGRIDEAEEQRQGFLEEKRAILAGREAKDLSDAERAQLRKVQKNLDTVNGKIRRLNEELSQTQEKKVVKELLKKARVVVERDAVQRGVARLNEYKNRRSAAELRTSIKKTAKAFQQMLLHPTDTKYAPESLIQSCIDVATMLDTSGEREDTKAKAQYRSMMDALNTLKTQYDDLKNNPDSDFRGEYDTNFAYMVEQLAKRLGGKPVRDLTLTELQDVHSVLRDIQTMLRNAKYQIGQAERITNYAVGESIIRDMEKIPERTVAERAMDTTSRLTISPLRNIRRITMYNDNSQLVRLFDALNDGIKKKNRFMMECDKLFERFLGKRFRKAAGLVKSYNVGTRTFKMTEMEAIQLVLTWEREAHGETSHLAKGGFIIPNHYLLKKGKFEDAFLKGTTYSHVQQSEIDAIQRTFDKWALDYKAAVKNEFFNGIAKNAINNTTFQLKGRAVALTPDYVTMEVDKNSVVTELEGVKFDATIEGMGMLKSVVKGASNPVIIRGVHSLVESHIERVGQLYGLAIPIRNFNKAYNVKTVDGTSSVRGAIGKTWSAAYLKMIEQAISDLQTPRKRADVFDKMVRKATSSFVKAKLLSNISVTIKQAASYSTAGLYLSQKALFPYQTTVVGLFVSNKSKFAKKLFAEIDEHTAEHYIRRKGMSMQEINTIAKDNSKIVRDMDENLPDAANPLKWIQNMDVATTAALWLATKKQVALDGMKTTDPGYWDAVTSLYEKVIEETQPMYDTLHRPEVQRTPNEIVRGVLMFRTQPLQNTGILYDAFGELNQAVKSKDAEWVKRARKKAAMAVGSQLASLAVFSVMTMLAGVAKNRLYRYLNDEDELTIQSIMLRVLGDMATNGAGLLIPIGGSELAELVEKQLTGSSYGGEFSVSVVDMLNDYIDQFGKCWKDVADLNDGGREKLPADLRDLSMDTAGLFGIPAENVFNIIRGVVGNISDTFSEEPVQWATDIPDPNVSAIKAAFDNGHMDTAKDKIVELIAFKVKSGKTEKEAASSVRSSITSYYKPLYLKALRSGDKEEMRRIASIIKASGLYSEGADATLEKWASAAD